MNVCLISREYPPFFGGGIGAYTVRWSRALAAAGHRVVVVTVSDDGAEGRDRDGDVVVVRLPFIRGSGQTGDWSGPHPNLATPEHRAAFDTFSPVAVFSMQIARALPRLVDEFAIDVVEAPDTGALAWFALNARRTGGLWGNGGAPAFVTCVHSPTEWIAEWNGAPLAGRRDTELVWMERDALAWSDGVVTPSSAMAAWLAEHWSMDPAGIAVVPYPLGELQSLAEQSCARGRATLPPPGSVVFAGRLEPRKGVRALLEAFALAVAGGSDLSLELAGEDMPDGAGRHGQGLVRALPGPARERVRPLGRLEAPALAAARARARTLVVPSPMDNFPNTCMEGMADGMIVIAARAGGMAEMIRDGVHGWLFEPGDARSLCGALRCASSLSAEQADQMGRAAARRILELCGNAPVTARRVQHYAAAIAGRRAGPATGRDYVVIRRSGATSRQLARLMDAAARSGSVFAHGWTRDSQGRVRVFSTPREPTLRLAPREIGPLVVTPSAARALPPGVPAWDAAAALARGGASGVVVPDVVVRDAGGRLGRLVRALRGA